MPATKTIAELGYTEAIKLMARGRVDSFALWRPEAFDRFREAIVDGEPSPEWMMRFNADLHEVISPEFTARFIAKDELSYPEHIVQDESGPAVVIRLTNSPGVAEVSGRFIVRPRAEQAIEIIKEVPFIM